MSASRVIEALTAVSSIRPTRVEIDLDAVRSNAATMVRVAQVPLFGVVKADAYGHGAVAVGKALAAAPGVAGLAVSLVEEGSQLRDAGVTSPILVMGPALRGGYDELVNRDMMAMITEPRDLEELATRGRQRGAPVRVHIKIDTGMSRLGLPATEINAVVQGSKVHGGLEIAGIATHMACAETDDPDDPACMTRVQLKRLRDAVDVVRAAGHKPGLLHAANSAAAWRFPEARLDRIRTGISLYGNGYRAARAGASLRQAMRWVTEVVQVRTIAAGSAVSYGALGRATRQTRAAIVPVGYADGFSRRLSGHAHVLIQGRRCPVIGAISMDISVVDVTALGGAVTVGDEVVLLGRQEQSHIGTAEIATQAGLLEYEVTCGISKRVPRVHLNSADAASLCVDTQSRALE